MLIQSRSVAATASDFHRFVLCKGDGPMVIVLIFIGEVIVCLIFKYFYYKNGGGI
jgi:hypothetical protein